MKITYENRSVNIPDFIVVGAGKCGTTSLHHYLRAHPDLFLPEIKETWFFHLISNPNKAILNQVPYLPKNFDEYTSLFSEATDNQICGEVTPSYIYYHNLTIKGIKKYYPEDSSPKIIIILREPIDKIFSHYRFVKKENLDPQGLNLKAALLAEAGRIRENKVLGDVFYTKNTKFYLQVKAYMDTFDNVKILLFDDLRDNPLSLIQDLFEYLEVDASFVPPNISEKYNVTREVERKESDWNSKSSLLNFFRPKKTPVDDYMNDPEILFHLKTIFRDEVYLLEKLINRDLSHWRKRYE